MTVRDRPGSPDAMPGARERGAGVIPLHYNRSIFDVQDPFLSPNNQIVMANSMTMPVFVLQDGRATGAAKPCNRRRPLVQPSRRHIHDPMHGIGEADHAGIGDDIEGVSHHLVGRIRERRLKRRGGSGPGSHRGRGARNHLRSDGRIGETVCDGFIDHAWLDACNIKGAMNPKDIRLSGMGGSRAAADHRR